MEGLGSHMKCFLYLKSTEERLKGLDRAWSILYHAEMTLEVALKDLRANKGTLMDREDMNLAWIKSKHIIIK